MLSTSYTPYRLDFKFTAITSRQSMTVKDTYFIAVSDSSRPGITGIGECALFRGLSSEDTPQYETRLREALRNPLDESLRAGFSSINFGIETALLDLQNGGRHILYDTPWTDGQTSITTNGLIWMGDKHLMAQRINEKLELGFKTLKLKIGGINFEDELSLVESIRSRFPKDILTLRLDANGSFSPESALNNLERLARYDIHSIEQPIKAGQPERMAYICANSPVPVALDEELIGCTPDDIKYQLLSSIQPQYIILKPSLCGGFRHADKWIVAAESLGIGWWATSALESNIGLNAIAQWLSSKNNTLTQGLGTGNLYHNNIPSPLRLVAQDLLFDNNGTWGPMPSMQAVI